LDGQHFTAPILFLGRTLPCEFYFYLLVAAGIAVNRKVALPMVGIVVPSPPGRGSGITMARYEY